METEIARLTARDPRAGRQAFNISSPQQLGKILFEDLGLPAPVQYGKGKAISTAADVLEELAPEHEIVRKVLEYRQLTKLKGTYVDALPALIDPRDRPPAHQLQPDRRGHRAALVVESEPAEHSDHDRTGPRDPRRVRAARGLEADGGGLLADRTAPAGAHVAGPGAGGAFRNGEDIHTRTAAEVMGVPPMLVTPRGAPQRQGGELRHRVRHQPFRPRGAIWASRARRPRRTSRVISSAMRG